MKNQTLTKESFVQNLVMNDEFIKEQITEKLGVGKKETKFIERLKHSNGLIPDVVVTNSDKIISLIEIKGADIGTNDYVRGTGQLLQYENLFETNSSPLNLDYSENFKTLFVIPSDVIQNNRFNIADFKYPRTSEIIEINIHNKVIRDDVKEDFKRLRSRNWDQVKAISPYYFRDNRIFEYFILLKLVVSIYKKDAPKKINRKEIEKKLIENIKVINNGNWRNSWITLSNMALINGNNIPTKRGIDLSDINYSDFATEVYNSYMKEYIIEIFDALKELKFSANNQQISNTIKKNNSNKEILFLTESKGRYISSFMNILRDDFGVLDFKRKEDNRKVNYQITEIDILDIPKNIKKYTNSNKYLYDAISILKI